MNTNYMSIDSLFTELYKGTYIQGKFDRVHNKSVLRCALFPNKEFSSMPYLKKLIRLQCQDRCLMERNNTVIRGL